MSFIEQSLSSNRESAFAQLDIDANGVLVGDELTGAASFLKSDWDTVDGIDTNKDGALSYEEFTDVSKSKKSVLMEMLDKMMKKMREALSGSSEEE